MERGLDMIQRNGWTPLVASECYNGTFPFELRARLAIWIEANLDSVHALDASVKRKVYFFLGHLVRTFRNQYPGPSPLLDILQKNARKVRFFLDLRRGLDAERRLTRRLLREEQESRRQPENPNEQFEELFDADDAPSWAYPREE